MRQKLFEDKETHAFSVIEPNYGRSMFQFLVHKNFDQLKGTLILQEFYQLHYIRKKQKTGSCGSPLGLRILPSGSIAQMLGSLPVIKILLMDLQRPYQVPDQINSQELCHYAVARFHLLDVQKQLLNQKTKFLS